MKVGLASVYLILRWVYVVLVVVDIDVIHKSGSSRLAILVKLLF